MAQDELNPNLELPEVTDIADEIFGTFSFVKDLYRKALLGKISATEDNLGSGGRMAPRFAD